MQKPFYTKAEYDVPDNWWNDATYYNVPVNEFMDALKMALKNVWVALNAWNFLNLPKLLSRHQKAEVLCNC